jgi:hypothetical protein
MADLNDLLDRISMMIHPTRLEAELPLLDISPLDVDLPTNPAFDSETLLKVYTRLNPQAPKAIYTDM